MLSANELLVIKELAIFGEKHNINKTNISKKIDLTQKTVRNIIKKLKEL